MIEMRGVAESRNAIFPVCTDTGCACYSLKSHNRLFHALLIFFSKNVRPIDGYIIKVDYSEQKKMAAAVSRAATNINHIFRRINALGISTLTIRETAEYSNTGINKIDSLLRAPTVPLLYSLGQKAGKARGI